MPAGGDAEFAEDFLQVVFDGVGASPLIGAGLARRKSPAKAALLSVMAGPLGLLTQAGDPVGAPLVRSVMWGGLTRTRSPALA